MAFSKPDLYVLGKEVEGKTQLHKAIIEMLMFFGYILQVDGRHYKRTSKKPPTIELDAFQSPTEPPTSSIKPTTDYFDTIEIKNAARELTGYNERYCKWVETS